MKAKIPHDFFVFASKFTMESMIYATCYWAKEKAFDPNNSTFGFASEEKYTLVHKGKTITYTTNIIQTWLIDMLYHIICKCSYGTKEISKAESLHLINLYNGYADELDAQYLKKDKNAILYVMGFFGEQSRFQGTGVFFEEFAREKYILDTISYRTPKEKTYDIDVMKEIADEVNYTTDEYSTLLLMIWGLLTKTSLMVNEVTLKKYLKYKNPLFSHENVLDVLSKNSITIDEIRRSGLNRQIFYAKPIIKIDDNYICSNPYLLLALFTNSNYWIMRNKYKRINSQKFTSAFGGYYETYFEEVLNNCLSSERFTRIPEASGEKRADWHIALGDYNLFVEQKSSLSLLGIKQSHPDVKAMKEHMIEHWAEAIKQLNDTQKFYKKDNTIKIILVYEEYYKSKCLDELFLLQQDLNNDNKFWLVTINELETLLYLYKTNPELALQIISEKDAIESTKIGSDRELKQIYYKHGFDNNLYLRNCGIYEEQFDRIKNLCK